MDTNSPVATTFPITKMVRAFCLVILICFLLLLGVYNETVFYLLNKGIIITANWLHLSYFLELLNKNTHAKVTMRSLPVMLTYGISYCMLCLAILHIYFNQKRKTILALILYTGLFLLCLFLITLGKVMGNLIPFYNLARRLIEMIISPLPVALLISGNLAFNHLAPTKE